MVTLDYIYCFGHDIVPVVGIHGDHGIVDGRHDDAFDDEITA